MEKPGGGKVFNILVITLLFTVSFALFYTSASEFTSLEIQRGGRGYVSDEVWYVSSARNILYKIFRVEPRLANSSYGATIVYDGFVDYARLRGDAAVFNVSVRADYSKLKGFYVLAPSKQVFESYLSRIKEYVNVVDVVPGWMLPDASGVNQYINWEHPPVVKYLVALSIWGLGDYPLHWRLPAIVAGALTVVLTYLAVLSLTRNQAVSLAVAILLMLDPLTRAMSSIMLLDIYVAFSTALSLALLVRGRLKQALVAGVVGGLFKFSALFILLPVALLIARRDLKKNPSLSTLVYSVATTALLAAGLFTALTTAASIPIASYMGFSNWVKHSLIGSFAWHASVKCTGPSCPVASAPWEWFTGANAFPLYIYPDGSALRAMGSWILWAPSLILALILTPACLRERRFGLLWLTYLGVLAGYVSLWIIGGRSQYSFYSIHLAPLVYSTLVYEAAFIVFNRDLLIDTLGYWGRLKEAMVKLLIA
ncbi:MAG: phospholipid carrier-dependent glycosyltransferase [Thermosphaera sp.]